MVFSIMGELIAQEVRVDAQQVVGQACFEHLHGATVLYEDRF